MYSVIFWKEVGYFEIRRALCFNYVALHLWERVATKHQKNENPTKTVISTLKMFSISSEVVNIWVLCTLEQKY